MWASDERALVLEDGDEFRGGGAPPPSRDADQELGEVTAHTEGLTLLERLPMAGGKLVDPAPVEEGLVAEDGYHQDAEAVETGEHAKVGPPPEFEEEKARDERPEVWSDQERGSPDVYLARPLVEEEHVVDYRQAYHLRSSAEEALERAHRRKAGIIRCECCPNGHNKGEKLGPEQDRKPILPCEKSRLSAGLNTHSPPVTLAQRYR